MKNISLSWCAFLLTVIACCFLFAGCPPRAGIEKKAWFRYASDFDAARNIAMANDASKKDTAMEDLARLEKLRQAFLQAEMPTEAEIVSLLRSPDRRLQKVGLVAMSLRPIQTEKVLTILLEYLQDKDFFYKVDAVYALGKFASFPKSVDLERRLLMIAGNESQVGVLCFEIALLARFPSDEVAQYMMQELVKEGAESYIIRRSAADALKKMGDSYYQNALEYVRKHGSPELVTELLGGERSSTQRKE
jgi:hypothetical protein